jgi:hypothetical protein
LGKRWILFGVILATKKIERRVVGVKRKRKVEVKEQHVAGPE